MRARHPLGIVVGLSRPLALQLLHEPGGCAGISCELQLKLYIF
uniref:Uncharacterized protein n=1 Tax=Arundo donax TaxID=35708 RepID=A0A0A9C7Z9_ARUDO